MIAPPNGKKWKVAVLGATGAVGQTFIRLLENHPWFELAEVAASDRSAGKMYRDAAVWRDGAMPASVGDLIVKNTDPSQIESLITFSALDSSVAGEVEEAFARAGKFVLSNAKNHRMQPDVPLVIPEVNCDHLELIEKQRAERGWSGAIITNANCAATVAAVALAPLHQKFGLEKLFLTTMQSVSGAGYPGVPSIDILGNIIPYIADEEPKLEKEMLKLLGRLENGSVVEGQFAVSAQTNRVAVEHGHTVCITASFHDHPSPEQAIAALREWQGAEGTRNLPSSPDAAIVVSDALDRPQPRRDVNAGNGMTVTVGRVREDPILDLRMVALGHNTIRGAAGGSVLNAEVLGATGRLPEA
ncbi:MAG TPA: aspartate-semialdehyde dehydrogenase [Gemmatimonadaceae bacterium]|nr:aspartate-semialdehyde dehydrogenase [Gemmatimonadaceae bacterium]